MILSIGMIVKNEEKYLDECLNSLVPILNNIDSELIIVDTGSTDNTIQIAKKYTNNVYNFKWCNDFSKARNETLKYAKGKWFMYLDADEILQDPSELINFFNTKEYEKYNGAKYIIKSYRNDKKTSYSSILSYRIYKLSKDTKFFGIIHEYISIPNEIKSLNKTVFDHYGYIFIDPKFARKKAERNIDLLKAEVKLSPDDPRLRSHLVDSYMIIDKFDESIKQAKIGIEIGNRTKLNNFYMALQPNLILSYMKINDHVNAIKECINYFKYTKMTLATDIDIYYFLITSYYSQKDYENCIKSYNKYIELINKYKSGQLVTMDLDLRGILCTDDITINSTKLMVANSYIQLKDYDNAFRLLENESLKNYIYMQNPSIYFNTQMDLMKKTNDYSNLLPLYDNTLSESNIAFLSILESIIEAFCKANKDDELTIIDSISNWSIETEFVKYVKIKYLFLHNNDNLNNELTEFCKSSIDLKKYNYDLLYYILNSNLSLSLIYGKANEQLLSFFIFSAYNKYDDFIDKALLYTHDSKLVEENYLMSVVYQNILFLLSKDKPETIIKFYNKYIECLRDYINFTYSSNIITDNELKYVHLLPINVLAGYYCLLAENFKANNDNTNYIKYLKLALKTNERYNNLISVLLDNFQKKVEAPISEFDMLAQAIKNNIISLISSNNIMQAKEVFNEYKLLNPQDEDIKNIQKLLKI